YLVNLQESLNNCEWKNSIINDCICGQAKLLEMSLRDAFQLLYWIVLDQNFGPKMANVLSEMPRENVLKLLQSAIDELSS
ncbi:MAG: hypothetical protein VX828_00465, partial [Candidatus Thermoplasmatota archaeon]|nr:hypothetical protein [Candidatus Thermoplasmatota archaeon]